MFPMSSCIQNVMETSPKVKKGLAELWYLIEDLIFFVKFANQGRFPPKTEKNEARQFVCTSGAMKRVEKKNIRLPSLRQAYIFLKLLFGSAF